MPFHLALSTRTSKCAWLISAFLVASVFPEHALAQKTADPKDALVNIFYDCCLKERFPHVTLPHTKGHEVSAFDPDSGRNFAWDKDKQAWIDVKTLERVCPGSKGGPPQYALVNIFYDCCLKRKFPHVTLPHTKGHEVSAFDPDSGRNFAWDKDKQVWIDTKTLECICPKCEPKRTAQPPPPSPTPSTTSKVTDALKTIGSSVNIGIGIGGGGGGHRRDERVRGEDRHRTAEKVRTDNKAHTTGTPHASTGKTVTSACKCHPCTCSPCHCH